MIRSILVLLITMGLAGDTLADKIYKWVDKDGRVHYSDKPPPKETEQAKEITKDLPDLNRSEIYRTNHKLNKVFPKISEMEKQLQRKEKESSDEAKARKERVCEQARRDLKILQGRVDFIDENGNSIKVSEQERAQRAKQFKALIEANCK